MDSEKRICNISKSEIYIYTLSNGIKCFVIPKKDFKTSMAAAVINFGSACEGFYENDSFFEIPYGTAHFIEHKLFDKKDKSIFSLLSQNGADVNAFTDHSKTAYYFSCQKDFYKNLKLLAETVSTPYFDEIGIENEKSIIKSEINMYKDIPERQVFTNLTKIMYPDSALGCEIAGTEKTIEKITPEILYKCYNTFYEPKNISFVCCGDIEPEKTALIIQNTNFKTDNIKKYLPTKEIKSKSDFYSEEKGLSEPVFNIGFKCGSFQNTPLNNLLLKMTFDILMSEGSILYQSLCDRQILYSTVGFGIVSSREGTFSVLSLKGTRPEYTAQKFIKSAQYLAQNGISQNSLKRIKSMYTGQMIRGFNSIEEISMAQTELAPFGFCLADREEALSKINGDMICSLSENIFKRQNAFLSVIK